MEWKVVSGHAEMVGMDSVEPGSTFDDKDLDKEGKEQVKALEEQGRVVKVETPKEDK